MNKEQNNEMEKEEIRQTIRNSIGWAMTKDKELLFNCFAHDPELFWFSPQDDGTIHGFKSFVNMVESFFMHGDFKAISYNIKDLIINISSSGDVAWYHARLDDFNEWKGQPANWENVRWTGVLEKRGDLWVIVQMHFSDSSE